MHWAIDLGVASLTRELSARLGAPAVLANFSRLLVDPNRPPGHETMFRTVADGLPVGLNLDLSDAERARRVEGYYQPYHDAVDAMMATTPGADLLSLHSFTDVYEGQPREVEIGVLYDRDEAVAMAWFEALCQGPYDVRLNEPWSGLDGLMYSPQLHALRHGRRAVELELRQDLLLDPVHAARLLDLLVAAAERIHGASSATR